MSCNQPVKIDFSDEEIAEIKQVIGDITLDLMEDGITVVFQDIGQDTPILPCSIHTFDTLPKRSHLQYRIGANRLTGENILVPAMVVVKLDSKIKDAYPWSVRVLYCLLHEYSHVKTVADVKRIDGKLDIDQEDCEYQCVKYMRDYLLQKFNNKFAEKMWLVIKVIMGMCFDSHYNKSWVWVLGLQDFEEMEKRNR